LILRNQSAEFASESNAVDGRFSFSQVKDSLKYQNELDPLQAALDRDYRVLTYLIEHAAGLELATLEDRLLMLDYRIMHRLYRLTRTLAPARARLALFEMANVLGILVHHLGVQAGTPSEA
jgi:uncharacterized protein with PhoU and TrkA domain